MNLMRLFVFACCVVMTRAGAARAWESSAGGAFTADAVAVDKHGDAVALVTDGELGSYSRLAAKLSGADGTVLWRAVVSPTLHYAVDELGAVMFDPRGDVVARGWVLPGSVPEYPDPVVLKLSGATGAELWRQPVDVWVETSGIGAAGDVVVAGASLEKAGDLGVVKLSGTNGAVQWRRVLPRGGDEAKLAIAADGDIVVAASRAQQLTMAKLSAAHGAVVWRRHLGNGRARAVTIVRSGDVVAGVDINRASAFAITKLSGRTGTTVWRRTFRGTATPFYDAEDEGIHYPKNSVAAVVGAQGDVVAAGMLENAGTGRDFVVVKLAGTTGDERWRRVIAGTAFDYSDHRGTTRHARDYANAVTVDRRGDVLAVGFITRPRSDSVGAVVKLSGRDGHRLWRTPLTDGVATAVVVDRKGHAVVTARDSRLFSVVKLRGGTGAGF